ncbi:putative transposase [Loktanella salsilacus]|uniref:Putative transposase n=1 Tax=Loktanella salsilacus TaxID=195913 RepID=A0A1I4HKH3_9RHOB|nr:DDE-type integrase/transposase/recombinase [Loktanella salsilacus]SFL41896.1 putative transposase [Loktanella salsilacus]
MPLDFKTTTRPTFFFDTVDRVTIDGIAYIPDYRNSEGYLFRREDSTGVSESFSFERLSNLHQAKRLSVEASYYDPQKAVRRMSVAANSVGLLSGPHEERVRMRNALVASFLEMEKAKEVIRTDASIEANRSQICARAASYFSAHAVLPNDKVVVQPRKFSARSLRRWLKQFEAFGMSGNVDKYADCGNRNGIVDHEARALLAKGVRGFLSLDRPTIQTIANRTRASFSVTNEARVSDGLLPLPVPSRGAVSAAIKRLDPFSVAVGRYGREAAVRQMRQTGQGICHLDRPMQRVEMDENRIDLMSIFREEGLVDFLSEDERQRLGLNGKKGRWWWTVAICATTRCIVGMRLSRTPTRHSALETLQMMMVDKGEWSDAVQARSPWNMCGLPELLVTDCGSAFKSTEFRTACEDLGIRTERAIAGFPQLRGRIERFFRTMSANLLPLLSGRTFSTIIQRGEYDSEARAALTADELTFALIRWVVDIYHNTPHEGLDGATPFETWQKASDTYGVRPPPSIDQMGPVFAKPMKRVLSGEGITVMGVRYHSDDLARYGVHNDEKLLDVRWYPGDIGAIWVKLETWVKVAAVFDGFDGVVAGDWITAARRLRMTLRGGQAVSQDIAYRAIREIDALNNAAKTRANILAEDLSEETLAHLEDSLFLGFVVGREPVQPARDRAADGIGDIVMPAVEDAEPPAAEAVIPRRRGTGTMKIEE